MSSLLSICARCQASLSCEFSMGSEKCWCDAYPLILNPDKGAACLCQSCLMTEMHAIIRQIIEDFRLTGQINDLTMYQTEKNIEGIDYYMENGFVIFTSWHHLKRGNCCGNGCLHCPFQSKRIL